MLTSVIARGIELCYEPHGSGEPLVLVGGMGLAVAEMRPRSR